MAELRVCPTALSLALTIDCTMHSILEARGTWSRSTRAKTRPAAMSVVIKKRLAAQQTVEFHALQPVRQSCTGIFPAVARQVAAESWVSSCTGSKGFPGAHVAMQQRGFTGID
eukprot:762533-Hanusia_phi.AAC.2